MCIATRRFHSMAFITTSAALTRVLSTTRRRHGRLTCCVNNEQRALPPADTSGRSPTAQPANFGFVAGTKLGISFTCTVNDCNTRISKMIRRSTYEHGTVLIQCPKCKTKHIIADNYGAFRVALGAHFLELCRLTDGQGGTPMCPPT